MLPYKTTSEGVFVIKDDQSESATYTYYMEMKSHSNLMTIIEKCINEPSNSTWVDIKDFVSYFFYLIMDDEHLVALCMALINSVEVLNTNGVTTALNALALSLQKVTDFSISHIVPGVLKALQKALAKRLSDRAIQDCFKIASIIIRNVEIEVDFLDCLLSLDSERTFLPTSASDDYIRALIACCESGTYFDLDHLKKVVNIFLSDMNHNEWEVSRLSLIGIQALLKLHPELSDQVVVSKRLRDHLSNFSYLAPTVVIETTKLLSLLSQLDDVSIESLPVDIFFKKICKERLVDEFYSSFIVGISTVLERYPQFLSSFVENSLFDLFLTSKTSFEMKYGGLVITKAILKSELDNYISHLVKIINTILEDSVDVEDERTLLVILEIIHLLQLRGIEVDVSSIKNAICSETEVSNAVEQLLDSISPHA